MNSTEQYLEKINEVDDRIAQLEKELKTLKKERFRLDEEFHDYIMS